MATRSHHGHRPEIDDPLLYSELVDLLGIDDGAQPTLMNNADLSGEGSWSSENRECDPVKVEPRQTRRRAPQSTRTPRTSSSAVAESYSDDDGEEDDADEEPAHQRYVRRSARFARSAHQGHVQTGSTPRPAKPASQPSYGMHKAATDPILLSVQREAEELAQAQAAKLPRTWTAIGKRKLGEGTPLSAKERKQRRLVRNRMSAHLHRERKKAYVSTLERTVLQFSKETRQLNHELAKLRAERARHMRRWQGEVLP